MRSRATVLILLASLPAGADPIVAETLTAQSIGRCYVQLTVRRLRGLPTGILRRARTPGAFGVPQCRKDLVPYQGPTRGPQRPDGDEIGSQELLFDHWGLADRVCGDGTWYYQLSDPDRDGAEAQDGRPLAKVEVKGCDANPPCLSPFETPPVTQFAEEASLRCNPMGAAVELTLGETWNLGAKKLSTPLFGQGVVSVAEKKIRAVGVGTAWYRLSGERDPLACIGFDVRPKEGSSPEDRRRWAFRWFPPPRGQTGDTVIELAQGETWTIPHVGSVTLSPRDSVLKPSVDATCRSAVRVTRSGDAAAYTGLELKTPEGVFHRYLINATGTAFDTPCNVTQTIQLTLGVDHRGRLPPLKLAGEEVVDRTGGKLRPLRTGVGYYGKSGGDRSCVKVVVDVPAEPATTAPRTREQRIADVRRKLPTAPAQPPTIIELKVGQSTTLDIAMDRISGTNAGMVELSFEKRGTKLTGMAVGYEAFVISDQMGRTEFYLVEVGP